MFTSVMVYSTISAFKCSVRCLCKLRKTDSNLILKNLSSITMHLIPTMHLYSSVPWESQDAVNRIERMKCTGKNFAKTVTVLAKKNCRKNNGLYPSTMLRLSFGLSSAQRIVSFLRGRFVELEKVPNLAELSGRIQGTTSRNILM